MHLGRIYYQYHENNKENIVQITINSELTKHKIFIHTLTIEHNNVASCNETDRPKILQSNFISRDRKVK